MANAIKNARKSQRSCCIESNGVVLRLVQHMGKIKTAREVVKVENPASIRAEPTIVYRINLIAA